MNVFRDVSYVVNLDLLTGWGCTQSTNYFQWELFIWKSNMICNQIMEGIAVLGFVQPRYFPKTRKIVLIISF